MCVRAVKNPLVAVIDSVTASVLLLCEPVSNLLHWGVCVIACIV